MLVTLIQLSLFADGASAQVYEGCTDYRGRPVLSLMDPQVGDIAMATTLGDGRPVILYNPAVVAKASPATRVFFYGHECAHHALGQLSSMPSRGNEQTADCWSVRTLTSQGVLTSSDLDVVARDLARFGTED